MLAVLLLLTSPGLEPIEPTFTVATMTQAQAEAKVRKLARYKVIIASSDDRHEGYTLYEVERVEGKMATVWFKGDVALDPGAAVTVRATMKVIRHEARALSTVSWSIGSLA